MVITTRDQRPETRDQRSEIRDQRPDNRDDAGSRDNRGDPRNCYMMGKLIANENLQKKVKSLR